MYLNEKDIFRNIEASNRNSFKVKALVFSNFRLLQKLKGLGYSWGMIADAIQPCVEWTVKADSLRSAYVSAVEYFSKPENEVPSPIAAEVPEPAGTSLSAQSEPSRRETETASVSQSNQKSVHSAPSATVEVVSSNKSKLLDAARRPKPSQSSAFQGQGHRHGQSHLVDDDEDDLEAEIRKQRRLFQEATSNPPHNATASRSDGKPTYPAGVGGKGKQKASESNSTDGSETDSGSASGTASGGKLMINANLM